MSTNRGWTPKPWVRPLPEWDPQSLPGYAEAKAKVERGESPFAPVPPATPKAPRFRRSLVSLIEERDRLMARRATLGRSTLPDDPGALSGTHRKPTRADARSAARMDRELGEYVDLSQRIAYLDGRIARLP